jgi:hypothetical protein
MQEWVRLQGLKVCVLFEGRDAAGKGGVSKRMSEPLSPRVCRVVALDTPTERERSQWHFQRYVQLACPHILLSVELAAPAVQPRPFAGYRAHRQAGTCCADRGKESSGSGIECPRHLRLTIA